MSGGYLLRSGLLAAVLTISTSHAQEHLWSRSFGDPTSQGTGSLGVAVDPFGNVIMAGGLVGSVDFGGGPLVSAGEEDIFIAKFDRDGVHLWSRRFGNPQWQAAQGVTTDSEGNVVIIGSFQGTIDFGGGPITGLGGPYTTSMFLAKFDPSGVHVWSLGSGTDGWAVGWRVAVDAEDHVLAAVTFGGSLDFGGGPIAGVEALLLVKFGPSRNHSWTVQLPVFRELEITDLAVDGTGSTLVGGTYRYVVGAPFATGAEHGNRRRNRPAEHQVYTFAAKFQADGDLEWSKDFGELNSPPVAAGVAFDTGGNAIVAAGFVGNAFVDGQFVVHAFEPSLLLIAIEASGVLAWARSARPPGSPNVADLVRESSGNLLVACQLWSRSQGTSDVYLMKFDSTGRPLTSWQFGDGEHQVVQSIAVDDLDAVVIAGTFEGAIDFGGGPLASQGSWDLFLAKRSAVATGVESPVGEVRLPILGLPRPNPTTGSVRMRCAVPDGGLTRIQIFDVKGRLVRTLVDGRLAPGEKEVSWDGLDSRRAPAPASVYLVQLRNGPTIQTRRITLAR